MKHKFQNVNNDVLPRFRRTGEIPWQMLRRVKYIEAFFT